MMRVKVLLLVIAFVLLHCDAWIINQQVATFFKSDNRYRALRLHETPTHKLDLNLLLIDHFDSFTYNLVDILSHYTIRPPTVVAANAATIWDEFLIEQCRLHNGRPFDGVILSPGPGHPDDPMYALSRDCIIQSENLPILGVCLGHQMLGTVYGAKVDLAPEPIHGQVHKIRLMHNNGAVVDPLWDNISASIDTPIRATRYHSLHVFDLNETNLIPTAVSDDTSSIVMSMRHKDRLHFGVQFHPESIGTNETGKKLLHNFVKICSQHQRKWNGYINARLPGNSMIPPSKKLHPALESYSIYIHKVPNLPPYGANMRPIDVVHDISSNEKYYFWLDEVRPVNDMNPGVSILGASNRRVEYWGKEKPKEQQGVFVWDNDDALVYKNQTMDIVTYLHTQHIDITNHATLVRFEETTSFERIDENAISATLPFDYRGGHVGYFGYEVRHDTQRYQDTNGNVNCDTFSKSIITTNDSTIPTSAFVWADKSFVFDHRTDEWYLVGVQSKTDKHDEDSAIIDWMKFMSKRLIDGRKPITAHAPSKLYLKSENTMPLFTPNRSQSTYMKNFAQCMEHIRQGESYELCLTNQFGSQVPQTDVTSPLDLYKILRRRNPAPFSAFFNWNLVQDQTRLHSSKHKQISAVSICCTSPERFVSVKRKRQEANASPFWEVEAKPIKGTIQRVLPSNGRNKLTDLEAKHDQELSHQLRSSVKDRAENLMIVDLLRNDLSQVCETGSVHVSKLMDIESYATVHQMVSTIRGRLRYDKNTIDVLKACFPGGSMTGAPKSRTMELLHELENGACRGPYSGCLGYISLNGCMDMNIIIRTAILTPEWSTLDVSRNDYWKVSIGAGGAITALSQPTDEYNEMKLKASAIIGAVEEWASLLSHPVEDDTYLLSSLVTINGHNSTCDNNKNSTMQLVCVDS